MRVLAVRGDLVGIFVGQLYQVEGTAVCKLDCIRDRLRMAGKQAGHFAGTFEMALGVAREPEACFVNGAGVADAGQHLLKAAAGGIVIKHVVGGDEGNVRRTGKRCEPMEPFGVVSVEAAGGGKIHPALQLCAKAGQARLKRLGDLLALKYIVRRDQGCDLTF